MRTALFTIVQDPLANSTAKQIAGLLELAVEMDLSGEIIR